MKLSASQVANRLDISVNTLSNWYRWKAQEIDTPVSAPKLPQFTRDWVGGPRRWEESDLPALQAFKEWIPKGRAGVMGKTNSRYWGERGIRADKNRV